ncbi:MAG: 16S rRNA (cytosine(1402)-N(4))-methyltransferase RsmH, partial [Pseudomonadota bacterium]
VSAADLINTADEATLADILFHYGEERKSRTIARAIVTDRDTRPFTRTSELADLVARVLGRRHNDPKHPATRTFQALRIAVNHEFQEVVAGLSGAERVLKPGGRLVVVTFHSLEDRIVKRWLTARTKQRGGGGSRHQPEKIELQQSSFELINRRPLTPSQAELARNPRSRSAKLRSATRLDTPPILDDGEVLGVKTVDLTRAGTRDSRQGRS